MPLDTRARLVDRLVVAQRASGLSHRAFAASVGLSESYWCHIRRRRAISLNAFARVMRHRPDLWLPVMNEVADMHLEAAV